MKIGDRTQQGRTDRVGLTGTKTLEPCPACKEFYLKSYFVYDNKLKKWIKTGKVCPNENCSFSRKG